MNVGSGDIDDASSSLSTRTINAAALSRPEIPVSRTRARVDIDTEPEPHAPEPEPRPAPPAPEVRPDQSGQFKRFSDIMREQF